MEGGTWHLGVCAASVTCPTAVSGAICLYAVLDSGPSACTDLLCLGSAALLEVPAAQGPASQRHPGMPAPSACASRQHGPHTFSKILAHWVPLPAAGAPAIMSFMALAFTVCKEGEGLVLMQQVLDGL